MIKVVQSTVSPGFGGLEMVIIEFHEWLLKKNIESHVLVVKGTPLERNLLGRGHQTSTHSVEKNDRTAIARWRKNLDSVDTAHLFHRQQALKQIIFSRFLGKISLISHTFYGVKKNDLWHRFVFSKVDQWIALTPAHKLNLMETTATADHKIKIISNGVDLEKFKPHYKAIPGSDTFIEIGVIARLDRKKGQDIAIHALRGLMGQGHRKWRLHLLGEDTPGEAPLRADLEKLAEDLKISANVVFAGFQKNIHEAILGLDIVWMPSHKETFGRCIIEAMAAGIPVIASNAGGVPDLIVDGNNGLLFETKNPHDLVRKTLALVENPLLFKNLQVQGRKDVEEKYDQEKIWQQLLETILPKKKHPVVKSVEVSAV